MPPSVASDLGLHDLPISILWVIRKRITLSKRLTRCTQVDSSTPMLDEAIFHFRDVGSILIYFG